MASSSSKSYCFHCKVGVSQLRNGWRIRGGDFAKLCEKCCSEYERDSFCETFHMDSEGWRDCRICEKLIHCGCRMSFHKFETLDFGGISCLACSRQSFVPDPNLKSTSGTEYDLGVGTEIFGPSKVAGKQTGIIEADPILLRSSRKRPDAPTTIRQPDKRRKQLVLGGMEPIQKSEDEPIHMHAMVVANTVTMQKQSEKIAELKRKLDESKQDAAAKEASTKDSKELTKS